MRRLALDAQEMSDGELLRMADFLSSQVDSMDDESEIGRAHV